MKELDRRSLMKGASAVLAGLSASRAGRAYALADDAIAPSERRQIALLAVEFMKTYGAPGMAVAIAANDRIVYSEAFGLADPAGETLTTRHRFRIASVSKPITSVAVMGLIEQGRLALGERVFGVGSVLGTTYGSRPYGPHIEEITVEHLLTHTAGGWSNGGPGPDPMFSNPRMNHAQLISWTLANIPLQNTPGERYAYSNFGYCLLGRIVEKRTGVSYSDYVRDNVLKPCGISTMEIAANSLADRKPQEVTYLGQNGEDPYRIPVTRMDAHGGWIATAADLVRFLIHVDGFPGRADILKPETIRVMVTPSAADSGYAKGWMVNSRNNWWHNGSMPGTTGLAVRTSGGLCWAALANTRRRGSTMDGDLDRLIWNMVGKVTRWPEDEVS